MSCLRIISISAALFFLATPLHADTIVFANGERLVGKIVRMEGGVLEFSSEIAGSVKVGIEKVQSIESDRPLTISLADGTSTKAASIRFVNGRAMLRGASNSDITVLRTDIAEIDHPDKPRVAWSRSLTAGLSSSHGNSTSTKLNIALHILRRSKRHRIRLDSLYLYGREDNPDADLDPDADDEITTEENFTLSAKYDYFFTKKIYGYLSGSYKKDHIANLDYRMIAGAGAGYQWLDSARLQWSTDIGLSLLREKYSSHVAIEYDDEDDNEGDEDADTRPAYRRQVDRNNDLSLQLGSSFSWNPSDRLKFMCTVQYVPALGDFSDYFLTADAELRAAINKKLFSSIKAIIDYDATPGEQSESTEKKYIVGLGLNF